MGNVIYIPVMVISPWKKRSKENNTYNFSGFEGLRERIPHPVLSKGKCEKLRKIDILHVAISYIRALENVLESGEPGINEFANSLYSVVSQDECQVPNSYLSYRIIDSFSADNKMKYYKIKRVLLWSLFWYLWKIVWNKDALHDFSL